ncbi:MAG: glycosyltransferase family 4 protein [Pseudomonadota bacterium]
MTRVPAGRRFLFDVTGLLHWYAYFRHPSGIQRVSERLVNAAPLCRAPHVEFVTRVLGSNRFYRIDHDLLLGLADAARRPRAIARLRGLFTVATRLGSARGLLADLRYYHLPYAYCGLWRLEGLVEAFFARGRPGPRPRLQPVPAPGPHDVFFHPGDLFWQRRSAQSLVELRRATGVRLVELVHDLFVVDHPEWFAADLVRLSRSGLATVAPHVDRWVTNSAFVRDRLAAHLDGQGLPMPPMGARPIGVLPMGWDSFDGGSADPEGDRAVLRRLGLLDRPFMLFVGTVEPRKNLPLLLDAVADLRGTLGDRVPDLAVVGGDGWKSAEVRARLRGTPGVHWFRAAGDGDLAVLYRHARFTVAPSFSEGWGLPVQESLAHGVPCIASSGGAMPEAAHGLAELFDPSDGAALRAALRRWILDPPALAAARARIAAFRTRTPLPTWDDAASFLLDFAWEGAADQTGEMSLNRTRSG